ncbi:Uncharacterised protein [Mycobacteroides abscessus subsp. abscessus]|nr:Uncharacterised protein [Mycobacteroides abscessus subsp. abscessus]
MNTCAESDSSASDDVDNPTTSCATKVTSPSPITRPSRRTYFPDALPASTTATP